MPEQQVMYYRLNFRPSYTESGIFGWSLKLGKTDFYFEVFPMIKKTPCGAWILIDDCGKRKKFILDNSLKKFAHPTKEAAVESFIHRKKRQSSILETQLSEVNKAIKDIADVDPNMIRQSSDWKLFI